MKRAGLVLLVAGIMLLVMGFRTGVAAMHDPIKLYDDENADVTTVGFFDMVEAEVYAVPDYFASETTTRNGVESGKSYFYIIPASWDEDDNTYYIAVKVSRKAVFSDYEKIMDLTSEYLRGIGGEEFGTVTVKATGCLKKMNSELKGYWYDWFREAEWFESEAELQQYALPVYIDDLADPKSMIWVPIAGIVLALAGGGLLIFIFFREGGLPVRTKTHAPEYVVIAGVTYPKNTFSHVNNCIMNQERVFAVQELHDITGLDMDEAGKIIDNWRQYYK